MRHRQRSFNVTFSDFCVANLYRLITACLLFSSIETIELHPDPPRRGEKLTVYFKGYLSKTVAKGTTVDIVVKFNVIQLIKKRFDFCDEIQKVDEECPIEPGVLEFTKEIDLPKEIRKCYAIVDKAERT